MCEPDGNSPTYADQLPKEGMRRNEVLYRIGIMHLIRKKVKEYEAINGVWSEPSKMPPPEEYAEFIANTYTYKKDKDILNLKQGDDSNRDSPAINGQTPTTDDPNQAPAKRGRPCKPKGQGYGLKQNSTNNENEENNESDGSEAGSTGIGSKFNDPDLDNDHRLKDDPKKHKKNFSFNIADAGFTELHTLWQTEESAAIKQKKLKEIWHRMHDYWLLAGIAKHGYTKWTDIQADPQYSLVQLPFLAMDKNKDGSVLEMQKGFLGRRFRLLETALIEEEQLRRAQIEKSQAIESKELLALQRHFSELEAIAECHSNLTKAEASSKKLANNVLQRSLTKMEELLVELKTDLAKLPMTISNLQPVQDRLQMNERYTVAHLLTASANLNDNSASNESQETRQQREQFKELAKNQHVAKALRFCNETGSFCIGQPVSLAKETNAVVESEIIELDDSDEDQKGEEKEKEKKEEDEMNDNSQSQDKKTEEDQKEDDESTPKKNGTVEEPIEKEETEEVKQEEPTQNGTIEPKEEVTETGDREQREQPVQPSKATDKEEIPVKQELEEPDKPCDDQNEKSESSEKETEENGNNVVLEDDTVVNTQSQEDDQTNEMEE